MVERLVAPAFFADTLVAGRFVAGVVGRDAGLAPVDRLVDVDFLLAAAFAGPAFGAAGHTPLASFGAAEALMTASLNPLRAVILAFLDALTRTGSPVAGLRAIRAGRSTLANFANPEIVTCSPLAATASMTSTVPRNAVSTARGSRPT